MSDFTPAKSSFSRVHLIEGRARPDHEPDFQSCMKLAGIDKSFGDVESIQCPDPGSLGKFKEIGRIQGADERATTSLIGKYAADLASVLYMLGRRKCSNDVHLNFGACGNDPTDNNDFTKKVILQDILITGWNTEDLGALTSDEAAKIDETADVSIGDFYEVLGLTFGQKADDLVTVEVIDVVICDQVSCGECDEESDGCRKIFAITLNNNGSPAAPPDCVFSLDGGNTWAAHDIDSMLTTEEPNAIECMGKYLVVVSDDSDSLHYALKSEFDGVTDPDWTEQATGFVPGRGPRAIWAANPHYAFIVGNWGYIYLCTDPTAGVTVLDAGTLTTSSLNAVHGISENFAVAVGQDGVIVYTENGETWSMAPATPVGIGTHFYAVLVLSKDVWMVGTSTGRIYYTKDGGHIWTEKTFAGSGAGAVRDFAQSTDSVLYMSHDTATPVGRIFRSYDAGYSWVLLPEGSSLMPDNDRFNALAACKNDANMVVGVGLGANGTDGIIVIGKD